MSEGGKCSLVPWGHAEHSNACESHGSRASANPQGEHPRNRLPHPTHLLPFLLSPIGLLWIEFGGLCTLWLWHEGACQHVLQSQEALSVLFPTVFTALEQVSSSPRMRAVLALNFGCHCR